MYCFFVHIAVRLIFRISFLCKEKCVLNFRQLLNSPYNNALKLKFKILVKYLIEKFVQ